MNTEDIHWEPIIAQLTAYVYCIIRSCRSCLKGEYASLPQEKIAEDLVLQVREKYLQNPNELDSSIYDNLLDFLKYKLKDLVFNEFINWNSIITKLTAFADSLIRPNSRLRGKYKSAKDFAMETILKHLDNLDGFDPCRGSFLNFLKFNILRRLISNASRLKEYQPDTNQDIRKLFYLFIEESKYRLRSEDTVEEIKREIEHDNILREIFTLLYEQGYTYEYVRAHLERTLGISPRAFREHVRRLREIVINIISNF